MHAPFKGVGVGVLIAGWTASAMPQTAATTLENRLAALERRVEQLEQENRELRVQVTRAWPEVLTPGAERAAASSEAMLGASAHPEREVPAGVEKTRLPVANPAALPKAASSPPASAEQKESDRFEFGGQIRFRGEVRQNADLNSPQHDSQDFVAQRLRFHARARLSSQVETFLQFQDSRLWGQEAATTSNDNLVDLHQGYLHVNDFLHPGIFLRTGRQELIYGAERLVGAFGWDNIGRSFDALKMGYNTKSWGSDWFVAKVVDRGTLVRNFERGQYLYGMYNQFFRQKPQHLELYGLLLRDGMRAEGEIAGAGRKATEIMTIGFRSDGSLTSGISYDVEFANQFGHRGYDPHSARAFAGKLYKTLDEKRQFRLGFEYDVATGDTHPADGRSGEFFNLFPTNHSHYGYADLMGWRNMQDFRPMLTFKPTGALKLDLDYHRFYLLAARGPWKNAGGAVLGFDPAGQSGTHVGDELDFTLAFPLAKHLKLLSGYALFFPGEFAQKTRGSDTQHYFYLQTTVDF
jgi:hypothetical protein